ncbi:MULTISPECIES: lysine N(6)-hydroxylase/L-ornithine N(5)-oxygenase family protein [Streptomyces]|jgi:L-ornithine N5-monooxygenase|uniref:L-lysine N6-monooxygenase MbtG n=1 Tax=Streptomyces apricus TaxID=1828112 RepID=A0A5A9ZUE3_9ACTN|nr:SidA/IucD/PvdA family monooxygenase [Streptomyces apricus]KAA0920536.1 lysine N(6)-hydroxylase/L-ornithine N(5)-oxygenase family protein [Streptomyces apricus]
MGSNNEIYEVVGIGFGPSNLSLAVALEEHRSNEHGNPMPALFFERQPTLGWHRNMLLPSARMQISFLKDLATFRNPASRFSFVSYVHAVGRLAQFVNNKEFFPTRQEFHDYLEWAESSFSDRVSYSSEVVSVKLPRAHRGAPADHVEVQVRDTAPHGTTRLVKARNIVVSTGLVPKMPSGIDRDERIWHSSEFLEKFRKLDQSKVKRVAVVGAGQSAAEIVRYVYDELPGAKVSAIMPSYGYSIADDTPFANRIFDADAVDDYYHGSARSKDAFWRYHKNTNYGVVDDEVIRDLHQRAYDDEVRGTPRLEFLNLSRVDSVKQTGEDVRLTMHSVRDDEAYQVDVDVLICATGYDSMEPTELLGELEGHCLRDEEGRFRVERDYRLTTTADVSCGVYLQGGTEHTHGLSSSLLSNIAIRSGEIADSIAERRSSRQYSAA